MSKETLEIGFLFPPVIPYDVDISKIEPIMKEHKYVLEQNINGTYVFYRKTTKFPDQVHIGKSGEFSRFAGLPNRSQISKSILDSFKVWRTTKALRSNLTKEEALPIHANSITIIVMGQMSIEYLRDFTNGIWKGFADSYYGLETTQSIGLHCILMQMNFKGTTLSDTELYRRIPIIEEKYNKLILLHKIDDELELPEDNLGFNFKDATISKSALAKILLGIQRQKYGKVE